MELMFAGVGTPQDLNDGSRVAFKVSSVRLQGGCSIPVLTHSQEARVKWLRVLSYSSVELGRLPDGS
jgi:hypothetical protein